MGQSPDDVFGWCVVHQVALVDDVSRHGVQTTQAINQPNVFGLLPVPEQSRKHLWVVFQSITPPSLHSFDELLVGFR
ncbi:Uncharacterised protein [Vibrio cholerae]|uniref:Uncharacterized protein n=1 Tax=Vibrio cholerae TaxID=666 RepID=A0A656AXK0_VIBCL|nr:Uncharacterised protein [Vibrio cholerae]